MTTYPLVGWIWNWGMGTIDIPTALNILIRYPQVQTYFPVPENLFECRLGALNFTHCLWIYITRIEISN
jgi:hypothetical protein